MEHYFKNIDGWFGFRHQYEDMFHWIPDNGTWVELGCYQGRSLCWLMVQRYNYNRHFNVYAIDSWPTDEDEQEFLDQVELGYGFLNKAVGRFKETMKPFDGQFTPIKSISWEAADQFEDGSIDYIMIDAGHDYASVTKDIKAWWPKIRSGGYMGGDDYDLRGGDVQSAVDGFVTANDLSVLIKPNIKESKGTYSKGSGNWLIKKP
jgi:hypothetical protein